MTTDTTAADHLADAKTHLLRATIAIKQAATADPSLLVKLGTPHATLQEVAASLPSLEPR
jgi:hypothetical protein